MTAGTTIIEPVAPTRNAPRSPSRGLDRLEGKVVGFIDNVKPNFHFLIDDIADLLMRDHGVASVVKHRKRTASVPAPDDIVEDIARKCDLVITGSGD